MLVALAFHPKDQDQAERLAVWIRDLGGCKGHELLLGIDSAVTSQRNAIQCYFEQSFDKVTVLPITNPYNEDENAWPKAANFCFATLARHIEENNLAPYWLWLESDCVFIRAGALDAIETEYKQAKKHFLGALVSVHTAEMDVPDHGSGIAVYPGLMTRYAGLALISFDIAWDVAAKDQILPQLHRTKLIVHAWKHPSFKDQSEVDNLLAANPEMMIFHSSKDGSLVDLLRARMNLPAPVLAESAERARNPALDALEAGRREAGEVLDNTTPRRVLDRESSGGQSFTCDLLLKTFPGDYPWVEYCCRSIAKFARGFRKLVILFPKGSEMPPFDVATGYDMPIQTIEVVEAGDSYLFQMCCKANAHEFTDASFVVHIDSDCVLTQPITPESFFHEGKPIWYMTKYSEIEVPWKPFTEKFLGEPVEYEFMRRLPMLVPRKLHETVANWCLWKHKQRLTDYILSQPNREFSEFNILGALAYSRRYQEYHWIDTTTVEMPEPFGIQHFSHDGVTPEVRARLEKILEENGNDNVAHNDSALVSDSKIRQTKEGIWILTNDTHISKWVEQHGSLEHDGQTLPFVLNEIPIGGTVIDVGASIGDSAAPFLHRVGPQGFVIALEPNPDAWECLRRNMAIYQNFCGYQVAASDKNEDLPFTLEENAGASHMDKRGTMNVHCITIDSIGPMDACDAIKIDVEGFELRVLQGAEQTIAKFHPKLLIEINEGALKRQGTSSGELFGWLRDHEYEWRPVQDLHIPDPPQYDIICKPLDNTRVRPEKSKSELTSNGGLLSGERHSSSGVTAGETAIIPWANKKESEAYIDKLALELKRFCTAPRSTLVVRERLRKIRVITKVR